MFALEVNFLDHLDFGVACYFSTRPFSLTIPCVPMIRVAFPCGLKKDRSAV